MAEKVMTALGEGQGFTGSPPVKKCRMNCSLAGCEVATGTIRAFIYLR